MEILSHLAALTFHTSTSRVSATISISGAVLFTEVYSQQDPHIVINVTEPAPASTRISCLMQRAIIRMNACGQKCQLRSLELALPHECVFRKDFGL